MKKVDGSKAIWSQNKKKKKKKTEGANSLKHNAEEARIRCTDGFTVVQLQKETKS